MADSRIPEYFKFVNLQMAAEAFLENAIQNQVELRAAILAGNGIDRSNKFPISLADQFVAEYEVVAHRTNSTTGFSGTLFRAKVTDPARGLVMGELTLSFRSTEFADDAIRDAKSTGDLEIKRLGWAIGQIADMEEWYEQLKLIGGLDSTHGIPPNSQLNVTGYSLGGHLATAFNLLRLEQGESARITNTYTFNGAGVGGLAPGVRLTDIVADFRAWRDSPGSIPWSNYPVAFRETIELQATNRIAEINAEEQRLRGLGVSFNPPLSAFELEIAQKGFDYQVGGCPGIC